MRIMRRERGVDRFQLRKVCTKGVREPVDEQKLTTIPNV